MSAFPQSFSWWCFANRGIDSGALLSAAAKAGYTGVDLIEEELWAEAKRRGLAIAAVNGHASIAEGLNRRTNAGRIEKELRANIAKAEKWRIPILICFSGNRGGQDDETGLDCCAEILASMAPMAVDAGVTLALELLNSKVDHRDYQADSSDWGVELCRRVGSSGFKLLYDIYHMQVMEGDIIRTIQSHHDLIAHFHTAGNPGRGQPDAAQELHYPAIYRAIGATGYRGYLSHEFIPAGDPVTALERAFQDCADAQRQRTP